VRDLLGKLLSGQVGLSFYAPVLTKGWFNALRIDLFFLSADCGFTLEKFEPKEENLWFLWEIREVEADWIVWEIVRELFSEELSSRTIL